MADNSFQIVIAGAGSIGCYVGGRLAAHGANVSLLLRPWLQDELNQHGIHISHLHGECYSNPPSLSWTTDPANLATADLVLITVKSGATESIAHTIQQHAKPSATVLTLQNGVSNLPLLEKLLPSFKVVRGMVPYNVVQLGEGRFHQATTGELWLGAGGEELAEQFTNWGVPSRYYDDISAVHWGKLLLNLNNPIQTLSGLTLKEELSKRGYRLVLAGAIDEARAVYKAAGIKAKAVTKIPIDWLPAALRLSDWIFQRVAKPVLDVDPAARSSMWEDLQRGRKTEIDEINGVIVKLAKEHGVSAPINGRLVQAIHQAENGKIKTMSPSDMLDH